MLLSRQERDERCGKQRQLESETEALKERLDASQRELSAVRSELTAHEAHRTTLSHKLNDRESMARGVEEQFRIFRERLAQALSVEPDEAKLWETIQDIHHSLRDKNAVSFERYLCWPSILSTLIAVFHRARHQMDLKSILFHSTNFCLSFYLFAVNKVPHFSICNLPFRFSASGPFGAPGG